MKRTFRPTKRMRKHPEAMERERAKRAYRHALRMGRQT